MVILSSPSGAGKTTLVKLLGKPEDIANAVNFLSSDQSDYINGETLHVNGGMYLG